MAKYLSNLWNSFKQFNELCKAIISNPTLVSIMMMIGRDEFVEQHAALGSMPQKFYNL
jgi:hypothetical protein